MKADPSVARLRFDRFELDEAEARLTCDGEPIALAPKPFAVLCALARTPGSLVTKNALLDLVWGHRFVTESVLKTAISEVRAVLDDDPKEPRYIETVSRRGYRFIAATVGALSQRTPAIERNVAARRDHPALSALTALCRGDAGLAELIRAVAATLEREPLVLNES
jgi:DNA-binding winged helix-turn-helix (wHTH) protein